jgi:hypothetical protein
MAIAQSRIVVDKSYQLNIRAVGEQYQAVFGSIIRMATAWGECKGRCQPRGWRGEKLVWDEDDDVTSRRSVVSMFTFDERQIFDIKNPAAFEQARLRQESSCELESMEHTTEVLVCFSSRHDSDPKALPRSEVWTTLLR